MNQNEAQNSKQHQNKIKTEKFTCHSSSPRTHKHKAICRTVEATFLSPPNPRNASRCWYQRRWKRKAARPIAAEAEQENKMEQTLTRESRPFENQKQNQNP
jgi:hypothetical protein